VLDVGGAPAERLGGDRPETAGHDGYNAGMPLASRVDPFGNLFADRSRGLLMGNRGGRIHGDDRKLGARRWASRQWICCVLAFNNRRREVWGHSYTELFFLDEVTAFAAGHRPCFECRRNDAGRFAAAWQEAHDLPARPRAADMDRVLHAERLDGRAKRRHRRAIDALPDGVMIAQGHDAFAVRGGALLRWTSNGYDGRRLRPRGITLEVLTPPAILGALSAGYAPRWHPSASG